MRSGLQKWPARCAEGGGVLLGAVHVDAEAVAAHAQLHAGTQASRPLPRTELRVSPQHIQLPVTDDLATGHARPRVRRHARQQVARDVEAVGRRSQLRPQMRLGVADAQAHAPQQARLGRALHALGAQTRRLALKDQSAARVRSPKWFKWAHA